jgi:DNA repair exonuclease SbcCD nuclease subunit
MVRFLHTADMQIGMRAKEATSAGSRLREARFTTLNSIITLAKDDSWPYRYY